MKTRVGRKKEKQKTRIEISEQTKKTTLILRNNNGITVTDEGEILKGFLCLFIRH